MKYDNNFYTERRKVTSSSAEKILNIVFNECKPESILDIGCATGIWLALAKEKGVNTILGIDGDWVPQEHLEIKKNEFIQENIEHITKVKSLVKTKFDMSLCIEVAEHLTEGTAIQLVDLLTSSSEVVLFSAAIPGQGGTGHINEQLQSYWKNEFHGKDFICIDLIRPKVWAESDVNLIYKQNIMVYVKKNSKAYNQFMMKNEECNNNYVLDRVHPRLLSKRMEKINPIGFLNRIKLAVKILIGRKI